MQIFIIPEEGWFGQPKYLFSRSYIKDDTVFIKAAFVEQKERKFSRIFLVTDI